VSSGENNTNPTVAGARPRLRGDLIFSPQLDEPQPYCVIEDPVNARFFRVGTAEYTFLRCLNGRATVGEATRTVVHKMPDSRFSLADAASLCQWLVHVDLLESHAAAAGAAGSAAADKAQGRFDWARFNLLTFKLPLCYPDAFFRIVTPYLSWMYSPVAWLIWALTVAAAVYVVGGSWERFATSTHGIFAPDNWLWLGGCWLLLKMVHEVSHGVVCKRYGGSVREAGVLLILLFPAAYVDVTSCWRFSSRWQRVHTAAAGMYAELFVAAVAAIAWAHVPAGQASSICTNVVVMASVTTVLFNANPLMRFDGYYMLADALAIPNLYARGQRSVRGWVRRYLLDLPARAEPCPPTTRSIIAVYGVLSCCWKITVCAGLIISASALFAGAGVVIAATGVISWLFMPAVRFVQYLFRGTPAEKPNLVRFAWSSALIATCVGVPLWTVPWPGARSAPAIVQYAPLTVIRANSPGFVRQVHVSDGQQVRRGEVLVELENPRLRMELTDLTLALDQLDLKRRSLANSHRMAELQAHEQHRLALEKRRAEKATQVDRLTVRAPVAGRVIGRDLGCLIGAYLDEGAQIVALADERSKQLKISVSQHDTDPFSANVGASVRVRLPGVATFRGTLSELAPRADVRLPDPSLCATFGGPLSVRAKDRSRDEADLGGEQFELFVPRLTGTVKLTGEQSERLRAGQRGIVSLASFRECIAHHLYRTVTNWVRDRFQRATKS